MNCSRKDTFFFDSRVTIPRNAAALSGTSNVTPENLQAAELSTLTNKSKKQVAAPRPRPRKPIPSPLFSPYGPCDGILTWRD